MSASENMRVATVTSPLHSQVVESDSTSQVEPTDPTKRPAKAQGKKRPAVTPPPPAVEHAPIAPPLSASVLKEMRQKRAKKLLMRVLALVVLPTLMAVVYFGFVATNEYESTTIVVVERRQPLHGNNPAASNDLTQEPSEPESAKSKTALKSATATALKDDLPLVKEFILSRDMLTKLDQKLHLLAHYGDRHVDYLSRLTTHASREKAYDYYKKKVSVTHDTGASTLTLTVRAFDSATATKAANFILQSSEQMLNALPRRAQQDNLKLTEGELTRVRLESDRLNAELAQATAPTPKKAGSPDAKQNGASSTNSLQQLTARAELQQRRLALGEERAQLLRDELTHHERYVVRVAGPSEPDAASYPQRGRAVITTFLFSIIAMGILSLLVSAVREHTNL